MAYTGFLPKDSIITEPQVGTARVNELDDAIRQIKSILLYGYENTVFASGNTAIASGIASYVRTGSGTAYLTLPQISAVAGSAVPRTITIFNDTSTSGSGGSLVVSAYAGDTISTLVDLWQNESVTLVGTTVDNEWKAKFNPTQSHIDSTAYTSLMQYFVPTGTILDFGGSSAPTGYLICSGQAISRTTYATLFSIVGIAFGAGDTTTTFNLPDLRRRITVGAGGTGTATLGNSIGDTGGAETHTLTTTEMPSHTHSAYQVSGAEGGMSPTGSGGVSAATYATGGAGSGGAHNNIQPSVVVNKIIKI